VNILAFDTATRATTVALSHGDHVAELRDDPPAGQRPRHATALLAMVSELLDQSGAGWESLDRIAVGVGPGTFTGLRVGIATAKALAQAAGTPLVGIPTLQSLALNAGEAPPDTAPTGVVAAVLDARRGEVFAATWAVGPTGELQQPLLRTRAMPPRDLAATLQQVGSGVLAIGDGAVAFREVLERPGVCVPRDASGLHRVTATRHLELARGQPVTPSDRLVPDYQRSPDAKAR
jgi:tRNA threonylcarbamoyladenosine biosynthesis protein TsaB